MEHLHTIPVDNTLSPEQAWREICHFGERVTFGGIIDPETDDQETWATMACDGEECLGIKRCDCQDA